MRTLLLHVVMLTVLGMYYFQFPTLLHAADVPSPVRAVSVKRGEIPEVRVMDGRLTVKLSAAPLSKVLDTIAQQSAMKVVLRGDAEEKITVAFANLPLDEGLGRILQGKSFTLIYRLPYSGSQGVEPVALRELHLLPTGETNAASQETVILNAESEAGSDEEQDKDTLETLSQNLLQGDTREVRKHAARDLANTLSAEAVEPLSQAVLQDEEPSVRRAAARSLGKSWSPEAVEPLRQTLLEDEDPAVRVTAAQALGETWSDDAIGPLTEALYNDPNERVRQRAAAALREVGYEEPLP